MLTSLGGRGDVVSWPQPPPAKTFLPLDVFDHSQDSGTKLVGRPALSRWAQANGDTSWEECTIVDYASNEGAYVIRWANGHGEKRVRRFNLRLAGEEEGGELEESWLARQRDAAELRSSTEEQYARLLRAEGAPPTRQESPRAKRRTIARDASNCRYLVERGVTAAAMMCTLAPSRANC